MLRRGSREEEEEDGRMISTPEHGSIITLGFHLTSKEEGKILSLLLNRITRNVFLLLSFKFYLLQKDAYQVLPISALSRPP
jgi:hypothetical protein